MVKSVQRGLRIGTRSPTAVHSSSLSSSGWRERVLCTVAGKKYAEEVQDSEGGRRED